jgi:hydroxyacid-oxoacid transhydrogenase
MTLESVLTVSSAALKYGPGATREAGFDIVEMGARRVLVVTDPQLASSEPVAVTLESLRRHGLDAVLYAEARVEPTDGSLREAVRAASDGGFDGFVGVGGGSSIDTAKAANLYTSWPADFLEYVNAPIGRGRPVPGPLRPMVGIPTTAGTGSETTGVIIFDYEQMRAKTGIAHRFVRPALGIVDPLNTRTMPRMVAACTGFDVLVHALESYTALPFNRREAPASPLERPAYQGANPVSDVWAARAIELAGAHLLRAVEDPEDLEARSVMILCATYAGIGFGNAGLHLPHGMSYPVSGMVKGYQPPGYPAGRPLVPHGMAVVLNAPAAFRFTAPANPQRHLEAARLLGAGAKPGRDAGPGSGKGAGPQDGGELLAAALIGLMRRAGMPNGLAAVGYSEADIEALVRGTLPQHRVTRLCPRPFTAEDLAGVFRASLRLW